jgi:hypothetical protein
MAVTVTHSTAALNAATNAVTALLTTGSKLVFRTAGDTEVATLSFADPAFGGATAGVATAGTITADDTATGNASPVTKATLETGAATMVITANVDTSGAAINMTNGVTVNANDTVSCSSLTYKAINA